MPAEDLLRFQKASPLRPFRITMNSGRAFEVRHPELLFVTAGALHVYSLNADGIPDRGETIALYLVESVKDAGGDASQ